MSPQSHQLPPGTVLFGTYEITGVLGGVVMGWVYREMHRSKGSTRASKGIRPDIVCDPDSGQLTKRESMTIRQILSQAPLKFLWEVRPSGGSTALIGRRIR